jgi:3-deoxy-manno-octulosonate cytidylyltransferase (CMP-KDO synthetase)
MGTLVRPLLDEERTNPNVVKVVLNERHDALYFSRADLPYQRGPGATQRWAHVGIYGYRFSVLEQLAGLPPTALEKAESLEQLRALGHGITIACRATQHAGQAVDRPEDVRLAEAALQQLLRHR